MLIIHLFILIMSVKTVYMQQDSCNCNCNKNEYFYEDCGHVASTSTINNGEEAYTGQFPWQVLVGIDNFSTGEFEICGGSLITHQHVLTAAHCVFGKSLEQISVLVGHLDWKKAQDQASDDFLFITDISIFPSYTNYETESDVGILTLEHSVSFSSRKFKNNLNPTISVVFIHSYDITTQNVFYKSVILVIAF